MHRFRVEGLPTAVAERVRRERADEHGNDHLIPIPVDECPGYLCRHCLADPLVGESVYLFSYSPFAGPRPYRSMGPVFVHTAACAPYERIGEIPPSLRHRLLSVRAYREDDRLVTSDVVPGDRLEELIQKLFDTESVACLDLHNARPGCFNCRLRRA